ncbi:hypothetical protein FRC08_010318, partial [Ceratobasidium sp. 394]
MYDESFNAESFSKRASPNKNRLPPSFPSNIFCHSCQTNQTLVVSMLSNYLPASSDPSYTKLLAEYPAYKASLYARYPPVCAGCQPAVDEQIGQKDSMARSSALGGWLEASTRRNNQPGADGGVSGAQAMVRVSKMQVVAWNIRGALWIGTLMWWLYVGIAGSVVYPNLPPGPLQPNIWAMLPSILWQFWDPTWRMLQRSQSQGREVRVEGKTVWVRCQGLIWIVRLTLCGIISLKLVEIPRPVFIAITPFEIMVNLFAFRNLRIIRPPRIRLVASSRTPVPALQPIPHSSEFGTISRMPSPQPPTEVPALSALSLSSFPSSRPTRAVNPIFGVTSLAQPPAQPQAQTYSEEHDPNAMDWTPANENTRQETIDWLRPARFAPEKPTGLEGLLEKFGIAGDEQEARPNASQNVGRNAGI